MGFRGNGMLQKLPFNHKSESDRILFSVLCDDIVRCLAHPENNVMVSLFMPCEILLARGLVPYSCEAFAAYLNGARTEQVFLRRAVEEGLPETLCSYHRAFLGAAYAGIMPRPRFIVSSSLPCAANALTFREMAEYFDVPHISIDVPYERSVRSVKNVADQLRELDSFISENTGIPSNTDALIETVARSCRTMRMYDRYLSDRAGKIILSDFQTESVRIADFRFLLGSEGSEECAARMLEESAKAPYGKAVRLLWIHTTPYWMKTLSAIFDRDPEVQIVTNDLSYDGVAPSLDADPCSPYEAMAERLVYSHFNGSIDNRIDRAAKVAKQTGADGIVWFCHWGCKHTLGGAAMAKRELESMGFPTLILNGDGCDSSFGGEEQAATRIEAFIEMLKR